MWDKLVPKEYGFYDLFNKHATAGLDAAKTLVIAAEEWPHSEGRVRRIEEIEHECDTLAHMSIDLLHRTFITPLDRDEIMALVSGLDDIVDLIDSAAQRMVMFEILSVPPKMTELARVLCRTQEQVVSLIGMLRGIKHVEPLREIFKEIHRLENEGDGLHRAGLVELFRTSSGDALTVIKLKEIYETIEAAIDRCEDVSNTVEGITLEHT